MTQRTWDGPSRCMRCFSGLDAEEKEAVSAYGYSDICFDEARGCANTTHCPDRVQHPGWASRMPERCVLRAADTDTSDKADLWLSPKKDWFALGTCSGCFADLRLEMQEALLHLGTDADCWNAPARANGLDCAGSSEARNRMYEAIEAKHGVPSANAAAFGRSDSAPLPGKSPVAAVAAAAALLGLVPVAGLAVILARCRKRGREEDAVAADVEDVLRAPRSSLDPRGSHITRSQSEEDSTEMQPLLA